MRSREAHEPEKFKEGQARMWSRYLWYSGSLEASMCPGALRGTVDKHLSLLPGMAPLVEGNQLHQSLRNADFCLRARIW